MKKRNARRLTVHRETLRLLEAPKGLAIAGGTESIHTSCECLIATGCECYTQDPACTLPYSACFGSCSC